MNYRLLAVLFLFLMVNVACWQLTVAPTPLSIRSIFDYDTCAPPCWMGLIPGESTVEDVEQMFQENEALITPENLSVHIVRLPSGAFDVDLNTGLMRAGGYYFDIGEVEYMPGRVTSRIDIEQGYIADMLILAYETVSLADVLENMGNPDIVRLYIGFGDKTWFHLIYLELNLRVTLTIQTDTCYTALLSEALMIDSIFYYSPSVASRIEVSTLSEYDIPQPNLTRYISFNDRDVPLELWQSWLTGEVDMPCKEAWAQLPVPEITPAVEATPTAP
jgi:hypothetical protein